MCFEFDLCYLFLGGLKEIKNLNADSIEVFTCSD